MATTYKGSTPLEVYNHAYGGATIDATLVTPYEPTVLSLTDQVNSFLANEALKPSYAPWTSTTAFFSFFIGKLGAISSREDWRWGALLYLFVTDPHFAGSVRA